MAAARRHPVLGCFALAGLLIATAAYGGTSAASSANFDACRLLTSAQVASATGWAVEPPRPLAPQVPPGPARASLCLFIGGGTDRSVELTTVPSGADLWSSQSQGQGTGTRSTDLIDGRKAVLWSAPHSQEALLLVRSQYVSVRVVNQFGLVRQDAAQHLANEVAQQISEIVRTA